MRKKIINVFVKKRLLSLREDNKNYYPLDESAEFDYVKRLT
tara:strand:- start:609 stop:731 length:123 start_codon:yes stop_codon:yes gene_type:complete